MSVVLAVTDVTKTYPMIPPVHALRGVTFSVQQGELVAVVGPSGSGKSTLLHVMGTLDRPSTGDVEVAGYRVSDLTDAELSALRARHIGFVFQQFHLLNGYTALDNVADGMLYAGVGIDGRRAMAKTALERVGLGHRFDHVATELSGGERQRVAIARALIGSPSLVLADEPTGNLDSQTGSDIVSLIEELHGSGSTIVVITHDLDIAGQFPRIVRLRDGMIESDTKAA